MRSVMACSTVSAMCSVGSMPSTPSDTNTEAFVQYRWLQAAEVSSTVEESGRARATS
ncbi:hypothetical protein [Mycobacterium servetii]|uniref:Secreted protein n=1 Tax=Mycobacterium servetii TaxID=3237418 RepID=A0ABV4C598_9MYCO